MAAPSRFWSALNQKYHKEHHDRRSGVDDELLVGSVVQNEILYTVIPAKAGIQGRIMCGQVWMPAFAGMTLVSARRTAPHFERLRPLGIRIAEHRACDGPYNDERTSPANPRRARRGRQTRS